MSPERVSVEVDGRRLSLSNLDKVLYPATGFSKRDVIDYYRRIAPVLLPHIESRPLSFKRFPDGVEGESFFAKNVPAGAPDWVRTARLPSPGSTKDRDQIDYVLLDDLPSLIWAANLAALELHVPMWRLDRRGSTVPPDLIVFDLDPGPPATIVECCRVAEVVRERLDADGLAALPKTSGSKGLQLYVPVRPERPWKEVHSYARRLAERLEGEHPKQIVSNMKKSLRGGKVLVDWSQNNAAKTTVSVYSLRARERPSVSTPVRWEEVENCRQSADLVFLADDVLRRVREQGDLFEPALHAERALAA